MRLSRIICQIVIPALSKALALPSNLNFTSDIDRSKVTDRTVDDTTLSDFSANNSSLLPQIANSTAMNADSFIVENCGAKTRSVQFLRFSVMETLAPALKDARYGIYSPCGFRAMFKRDDAIPTIVLILQHMYTMQGLLNLRPDPNIRTRPRFACVDFDSGRKYRYLNLDYDPWSRCLSEAVEYVGGYLFYAEGTAYIFLCSFFFALEPQPRSDTCPTVSRNRFVGDQRDFCGRYQIYKMIYELNRFYLGRNALDAHSDPHEEWDWNLCVTDLGMVHSVVNPTSLELYVARESLLGGWIDGLASQFHTLTGLRDLVHM